VSSLLRLSTPCTRPPVDAMRDAVPPRTPRPVAGRGTDPKPGFITRLQPSEALPTFPAGGRMPPC
jgi:hypothetical protein